MDWGHGVGTSELFLSASEIDWGDAPAWAAAGVAVLALLISVPSAVLSWKSLRWERLSAEAALRSAEAAERANRFAEEAVRWQRAAAQDIEPTGIPSEEAFGNATVTQPPRVSWQIENPSENRYVLRNTGSDVAEHVEVDPEQASTIARNLPRDATIRPGEGHDMLMMSAWGHPVPNQLYVRWEGHPDWLAVPIR